MKPTGDGTETEETVAVRSGSVFADIGVPDPETHTLKANIVIEIDRARSQRKLTQKQTGALLGISQPEVSRMLAGHFREYSVERLLRFLTAFDRNVEITVSRSERSDGPGDIIFKRPTEAVA